MAAAVFGQNVTSLGEYAKALRAGPHPKAAANRRFDNDNLPRQTTISVLGEKPVANKVQEAAESAEPAQSEGTTAPDEPAVRLAAYVEWQKKIAEQKQAIEMLSRELDVLQRELSLRVAQYYGDAGYQLQNSAQWYKQNMEYQRNIAEKQQAMTTAKQKLDDLQEEARKAGVPAGMRE